MCKIRVNPTLDFINIFDEIFESYDETSRKCPIHDVIENDKEFIIEMILAGIDRENINLNVEDGILIIDATRPEKKDLKYNRKELYTGKYKRSFVLPDNVDVDNINAELKDGILIIIIPKLKIEEPKKIKIKIK